MRIARTCILIGNVFNLRRNLIVQTIIQQVNQYTNYNSQYQSTENV